MEQDQAEMQRHAAFRRERMLASGLLREPEPAQPEAGGRLLLEGLQVTDDGGGVLVGDGALGEDGHLLGGGPHRLIDVERLHADERRGVLAVGQRPAA